VTYDERGWLDSDGNLSKNFWGCAEPQYRATGAAGTQMLTRVQTVGRALRRARIADRQAVARIWYGCAAGSLRCGKGIRHNLRGLGASIVSCCGTNLGRVVAHNPNWSSTCAELMARVSVEVVARLARALLCFCAARYCFTRPRATIGRWHVLRSFDLDTPRDAPVAVADFWQLRNQGKSGSYEWMMPWHRAGPAAADRRVVQPTIASIKTPPTRTRKGCR
jgi:hypothetical protein